MTKLKDLAESLIFGITAILLFVLVVLRLVIKTQVSQNQAEVVRSTGQSWIFYLLLLLVLALLWLGRNRLVKLSSKTLFIAGTALQAIFGTWLLCSAPSLLRADVLLTLEAAQQANRGDYQSFDVLHGYLAKYPHQLGLVSFERLFTWGSTPYTYFALNLVLVLLANWCLWQILEVVFEKHRLVINVGLLLIFSFLPPFFFILFVYGHIPGYSFLALGMWGLLKFWQSKTQPEKLSAPTFKLRYQGTKRYLLFAFIGIIVGYETRNNNSIALVALAAIALLMAVMLRRKLLVALTVVLLLLIPVTSHLNMAYYKWETGHELNTGIPKLAWAVMGLQESRRAPGWFNSYNIKLFEDAGFDPEAAKIKAKEDLKNRVTQLQKQPLYSVSFFARKINSTWNEPTYESIWSGPLPDMAPFSNGFWKSIYSAHLLYKLTYWFLSVISVLIYFGAAIFPWISRGRLHPQKRLLLLCGHLYFLGGFLFHLVWETKSQYVFPYVCLLIPAAALSWGWLLENVKLPALGYSVDRGEHTS